MFDWKGGVALVTGAAGGAGCVLAGVVHLFSDEASWVTGPSLVLSGGGSE